MNDNNQISNFYEEDSVTYDETRWNKRGGIKTANAVSGGMDGATSSANSTHADGFNKSKQAAGKIKK